MTIRSYIIGYTFSILLTLAAFGFVWLSLEGISIVSGTALVTVLVGLALGQLYVQLVTFLHVGQEQKPRWNLISLIYAGFITFALVGGTIWVMYHLDHDAMQERFDKMYPSGVITPQEQNG